MENEKSKLGELFKQAFDDFKPEPSPGVWEKLSHRPELIKTATPSGSVSSWWKWILGGTSITAVIIAIVLFMGHPETPPVPSPLTTGQNQVNEQKAPVANAYESTVQPGADIHKDAVTTALKERNISSAIQDHPGVFTADPHSPSTYLSEASSDKKPSAQSRLANTPFAAQQGNTPFENPASQNKVKNTQSPAGQLSIDKPSPKEGIEVVGSQKLCKGESLSLWVTGATTCAWSTGETTETITVSPSSTTIYSVTVTDHTGQQGLYDITITVMDCKSVYIPTAFSPNNDGVNDVYKVYGTDITNFTLRIVSRTGQIIYETRDINEGWDGKMKGDIAEMGIYIYQVIYTDSVGKEHKETGQLTLLR